MTQASMGFLNAKSLSVLRKGSYSAEEERTER